METSPWSQQGAPSATLPTPAGPPLPPPQHSPAPNPYAGQPQWTSPPQQGQPPQTPQTSKWRIGVIVAVAVAASAISCAATALWLSHSHQNSAASASAPTTQPVAAPPQFSPEQVGAAKDFLCHTFDVSVRGQEGQGALRIEGNLNVQAALRSVNSAMAVQNAIVPMLPADVAAAARAYVTKTLTVTTAVMGNPRADEVNHLNDIRNSATEDLLGACGLPR